MHNHTKQQLESLVEKLADIEHQRWSKWQKYLHSQCFPDEQGNLIIPIGRVRHWERQINTDYKDLSEKEKGSDREQVYEYLPLIQQALKSQAEMIRAEMVPKHRHLRTDDDDLRIGYNSARSEVKANLDNLITSFE